MAGFKPGESKGDFGDAAQRKGTRQSQETAKTTAATPQEPHVETPEEIAARKKEERRKKRHAAASARRREERHRKKAEKKNIALNEKALGVSIDPNTNMSVAPCTSLTGAGDGSVSPLSESQNGTVKIGVSLFYSIYTDDELVGEDKRTLGDQIHNNGFGDMNYHDEIEFDGTPYSADVDYNCYPFVDCSNCLFNLSTLEIDDNEGMQKCLDRGLSQLIEICYSYAFARNCHIVINIGGYDLTHELVAMTKFLITDEPPKDMIHIDLLCHGIEKYRSQIIELKAQGFQFEISYTCLYKAFAALGDGTKAKKKREEKEYVRKVQSSPLLAMGPDPSLHYVAGGGAGYLMGYTIVGNSSAESAMGMIHLLLAAGSLCFFFPPFALFCILADISLYAVECVAAFNENNREAAIASMKGVMMDGFFTIPYRKIGMFLKKGAGMLRRKGQMNKAYAELEKAVAAEKAAHQKVGLTEGTSVADMESKMAKNTAEAARARNNADTARAKAQAQVAELAPLETEATRLEGIAQQQEAKLAELKAKRTMNGVIVLSPETIAMMDGEILRAEGEVTEARIAANQARSKVNATKAEQAKRPWESLATRLDEHAAALEEENRLLTDCITQTNNAAEKTQIAVAKQSEYTTYKNTPIVVKETRASRYFDLAGMDYTASSTIVGTKDIIIEANQIDDQVEAREAMKYEEFPEKIRLYLLLSALKSCWEADKFIDVREALQESAEYLYLTFGPNSPIYMNERDTTFYDPSKGEVYTHNSDFSYGEISFKEVALKSASELIPDFIDALFLGANEAW